MFAFKIYDIGIFKQTKARSISRNERIIRAQPEIGHPSQEYERPRQLDSIHRNSRNEVGVDLNSVRFARVELDCVDLGSQLSWKTVVIELSIHSG